METLEYRRADARDLDLLVETRAEVLRAANGLPADAALSAVRRASRDYFTRTLGTPAHTTFLALDGGAFAGCGSVCFYEVMPTYHNPSGRKAYLMNLYTRPLYRRRGIARRTLELLVREARAQGAGQITLEATAMGRPLYESYGFLAMPDEMELP